MKTFIIGGTGLISTAMLDPLLSRGDDVVCFNRGQSPLRSQRKPRVILGDRNDEAALTAALKAEKPDAVIDMVAFVPSQAEALLRAASGNTKQLIVCSTVCAYGGVLNKLPATEDEPHKPAGDYGKNKTAIEELVLHNRMGLHGTVIRPSFSTGEGATANGLVFDDSTVSRLRQGLPVIIMDDGKAAWSIAHVSDVAMAFVGALGNPKAYGQDYHATSDEATDWNGVFAALAQAAAGSAKPVFKHIPTAWLYAQAPRRSVGIEYIYKYPSIFDNSKAARDLGFKTTVPLVETFRRQILWMEREGRLKQVQEETVQTELVAAYSEGRSVVPGRFEDWNPWGNGTTG